MTHSISATLAVKSSYCCQFIETSGCFALTCSQIPPSRHLYDAHWPLGAPLRVSNLNSDVGLQAISTRCDDSGGINISLS